MSTDGSQVSHARRAEYHNMGYPHIEDEFSPDDDEKFIEGPGSIDEEDDEEMGFGEDDEEESGDNDEEDF